MLLWEPSTFNTVASYFLHIANASLVFRFTQCVELCEDAIFSTFFFPCCKGFVLLLEMSHSLLRMCIVVGWDFGAICFGSHRIESRRVGLFDYLLWSKIHSWYIRAKQNLELFELKSWRHIVSRGADLYMSIQFVYRAGARSIWKSTSKGVLLAQQT